MTNFDLYEGTSHHGSETPSPAMERITKAPPREQWTSRLGFILSSLGAAVGIGNIWRFPYLVGENGGGAFLLIYLTCIAFICLPLMLVELAIGRQAQAEPVGAFQVLAPGTRWRLAGKLALVSSTVLLSIFSLVGGWTLRYFVGYLTGSMWQRPDGGYETVFADFVAHPFAPWLWQLAFLGICVGIVSLGVQRGIEASNKIMMPLLFVLVAALAVYSLSLGAAAEGLRFLFTPDWAVLAKPGVYIAAMGQAFFSLSLGMGIMTTYGSYLDRTEPLPSLAAIITGLDTLVAILAGLIVFPALFAFGMENASGTGLAFVIFPEIFHDLEVVGPYFGILFFLLLVMAVVSSAVPMVEMMTAYAMRRFRLPRVPATLGAGALVAVMGLPSALSMGLLSGFRIFGLNLFSFMDYVTNNVLLLLTGLSFVLFAGWFWRKADLLAASDLKTPWLQAIYCRLVRWVAPAAIVVILLWGLFAS